MSFEDPCENPPLAKNIKWSNNFKEEEDMHGSMLAWIQYVEMSKKVRRIYQENKKFIPKCTFSF